MPHEGHADLAARWGSSPYSASGEVRELVGRDTLTDRCERLLDALDDAAEADAAAAPGEVETALAAERLRLERELFGEDEEEQDEKEEEEEEGENMDTD